MLSLSPGSAAPPAIARKKIPGHRRQPPFRYRGAKLGHHLLVEADIVLGHQHCAQDFSGFHKMMEIGPAPPCADRAAAIGVQRPLVLGNAPVADFYRPVTGKGLTGPAGGGRPPAGTPAHPPA